MNYDWEDLEKSASVRNSVLRFTNVLQTNADTLFGNMCKEF